MPSSRQLAAIMFTDIVGYTALMGKDSAKALDLIRISKDIQKPLVEKHNGKWLKEMGDGAMAQFSTALDAVNCSIEIQESARAKLDAKLRIGIHLGDVTVEENDVHGDGVNVASRLESIADAGGIYISESIEKAIQGQTDVQAKYLGEVKLKNVAYGVRTYALQGVGLPVPSGLQPRKHLGKSVLRIAAIIAIVIATVTIAVTLVYQNYFNRLAKFSSKVAFVQIALPDSIYLAVDSDYPTLALSPDGSILVFVGEENGVRQLYKKELSNPLISVIDGTIGAVNPFFKADGLWIGFFLGNAIWKVSASGGLPIAIHAATSKGVHRGATWYQEDSLLFSPSSNEGLAIGAAIGDQKRSYSQWRSISMGKGVAHSWPHELSGFNMVLVAEVKSGREEDSDISILSLEDRTTRILVNGGRFPRYDGNGHLVFARKNVLLAVSFDIGSMEIRGKDFVVVDNVMWSPNGCVQFAVGGGNLAYAESSEVQPSERLVWVDRNGNTESILERNNFAYPALSPDGSLLAIMRIDGPNSDLWLLDLARGTFSRLTSHIGEDFGPVWSPDGKTLAFSSEIAEDDGELGPGIALLSLGSTDPPLRVLRTPEIGFWEFPTSWSPDGKWLLFASTSGEPSHDIELMNLDDKDRIVVVKTDNAEFGAVFSPDGNWIAYVSNLSGQTEIYVKSFPDPGPSHLVSISGGQEPRWSRSGNELFYRHGNTLLSVSVSYEPSITFQTPRVLFQGAFKSTDFGGGNANYDVTQDGKQFVMIERVNQVKPHFINLVMNWTELLNQ